MERKGCFPCSKPRTWGDMQKNAWKVIQMKLLVLFPTLSLPLALTHSLPSKDEVIQSIFIKEERNEWIFEQMTDPSLLSPPLFFIRNAFNFLNAFFAKTSLALHFLYLLPLPPFFSFTPSHLNPSHSQLDSIPSSVPVLQSKTRIIARFFFPSSLHSLPPLPSSFRRSCCCSCIPEPSQVTWRRRRWWWHSWSVPGKNSHISTISLFHTHISFLCLFSILNLIISIHLIVAQIFEWFQVNEWLSSREAERKSKNRDETWTLPATVFSSSSCPLQVFLLPSNLWISWHERKKEGERLKEN